MLSCRRAALGGVLFAVLACGAEHPNVLRIGDAVPRAPDSNSFDVVARSLLDREMMPRVEVAPWTVSTKDLGIGDDAQARAFIADTTIVAVVGHAGSRPTLMVEPLYREAGMPLIVPTATARTLRAISGNVFMLAPPDDLIGAFLVDEAMVRLRARRLGILYVADPYGSGIHDGVQARLRERGDSLVASAALSGRECEIDALAMDAIVKAFLQRANPDAVVVALPQQDAWCAVRAIAREAPSTTILTADSFVLHPDWPLSREERTNVHTLLFWEPGSDSVTRAFVAKSRSILGRDPEPSHALEYDGFQLVVAAVRDGARTRAEVTAWLRQLGTPGHPAFQGISGPIDFLRPRTSVLRLRSLRDSTPGQ